MAHVEHRDDERVHIAVEGIPPDFQLVRDAPKSERDRNYCAADMVRCLMLQGATYWRVVSEVATNQIVAEGWRETPYLAARYEPPKLASRSGIAMDLTPMDRARLRNITRKTHRMYFRDEPTDAMLDEMIDSLGAQAAANIVKQAVDSNRIN